MSSQLPPDVSIIIASYNTLDLLDECLGSIRSKPSRVSLEVIVVDNASSDGSSRMVEEKYPSTVLICNPENMGFARANNQALRICKGRYAMLLNSDTRVGEGALEAMVAFLDDQTAVGIVGPQLRNPDGTLQPSGNRIPSALGEIWWSLPLHRLFGAESWRKRYLDTKRDYSQTRDVDEVSGAALMVRREVWETVGLLDEEYFFYFEDIDFCMRAKQAGWRVAYLPSAKIIHHWGMSTKAVGASLQPRSLPGHYRYMRKFHGRLSELTLRAIHATKAVVKLMLLRARGRYRQDHLQATRDMLNLSLGLKSTPHRPL